MPSRRDVLKVGLLATFLVMGQFLCCLYSSPRLWPFNPILVYVSHSGPQLRGPLLVAYSGSEEANLVEMGWCSELFERKLAAGLMSMQAARREQALRELAGFFAKRGKGRFEGLRLYRLTWDLPSAQVVERDRVAQCRWP
jgi:hypothetical protein